MFRQKFGTPLPDYVFCQTRSPKCNIYFRVNLSHKQLVVFWMLKMRKLVGGYMCFIGLWCLHAGVEELRKIDILLMQVTSCQKPVNINA